MSFAGLWPEIKYWLQIHNNEEVVDSCVNVLSCMAGFGWGAIRVNFLVPLLMCSGKDEGLT